MCVCVCVCVCVRARVCVIEDGRKGDESPSLSLLSNGRGGPGPQ